jgi:hypothetical protein
MSTSKSGLSVRKVLRWVVLAVLVVVIFLLVKKPRPVAEPMSPQVVQQKIEEFQGKLRDLQLSHERGVSAQAEFTTEEVNAAFQQGAAEQAASTAAKSQSRSASEPPPDVQSTQISFLGDQVTGQFKVNMMGKDIYLTISGKIGVSDGYATFEFTQAKIGDMPVPVSLLNSRLQQKLQEPETKQKLKLPDYISDLRVEHGRLVMVEK